MEAIEVEAESLRRVATGLTQAVDDADGVLQRFLTQVESLGEPWGNDDLGSMIGTVYQAALAMVMNCFTDNLDTVDDYGELLGVAADDYDDTDTQAATTMTGVGQTYSGWAV